MGKAKHKPIPSPPRWYWWDTDGCWWCEFRHNQRGCTGCKHLKRLVAKQKEREKYKQIEDM